MRKGGRNVLGNGKINLSCGGLEMVRDGGGKEGKRMGMKKKRATKKKNFGKQVLMFEKSFKTKPPSRVAKRMVREKPKAYPRKGGI